MYCLMRGWKSTTGSDRSFLFASPLAKFYARGGGFGIHSNLQNIQFTKHLVYKTFKFAPKIEEYDMTFNVKVLYISLTERI